MKSRDAILEATRTVIGEAGFSGANIAAVAKRAGVSRQTVYKIFGSRENMVSEAVTDRLTGLVGAFADLLETAGSPLEIVVEILVQVRGRIREDPVLRELTLSGTANPVFDPGAAERANHYVVALLTPAAGRFPQMAGHLDFLADIGVHVGWSVLCLDSPGSRPDAELRKFLTDWLAPVFATIEAAPHAGGPVQAAGPAGPHAT